MVTKDVLIKTTEKLGKEWGEATYHKVTVSGENEDAVDKAVQAIIEYQPQFEVVDEVVDTEFDVE